MPIGRRSLLVFALLPVLTLVAGLVTMGAHAQDRPAPGATTAAADAGCRDHALKYTVTDDRAELQRQMAFEATNAEVTAAGFYARPTASTPTLHAASHGAVVVFYRPGLSAAQLRGLHALVARATATKAPVVVTPRAQRAAFTALGMGHQLDCTAADAAQTARVRAFAAAIYPSLSPTPSSRS